MKTILFIFASFLLFTACGDATPAEEKKERPIKRIAGWNLLKEDDFTIQYPKDWELNQNGQMGTKFILFSATEGPEDTFRENVNMISQDLGGQSVDLDQYTEISEKQIKTMMTNCTVYESKRMKDENGAFQKLIYAADQGTFRLKFEQRYWIENEKAYVLTLTCEEAKFSSFQPIGEKIMSTFMLR